MSRVFVAAPIHFPDFHVNRHEYALLIGARRAEAERVPFVVVAPKSWSPQVAKCHENVDAWVAEYPGCRAVRGWVTLHAFGLGMRLTAHSVFEGADGAPFDITPLENEHYRQGMRFVRHIGDEQSFNDLRAASVFLDCPNWLDT